MRKLFLIGFLLLFILSCGGDETTGDNDNEHDDSDNYNGSEVITFKDPNMEKCVREEVDKLEGELTVEDVKDIESLNCLRMNITEIDGVEKLPNVNEVSFRYNDIVDFSILKNMHGLKKLIIDSNENVNPDTLSELDNIEELSAINCGFTSLDFLKTLTGITWLSVKSNNLTSIEEVKNLKGLTWLSIHENSINSLKGIENMENLRRLTAMSNSLTSIEEVKNLINLESLYISTNYLENDDLPVLLNLEKLEKLDIRENCITDFSVIDQMKTNFPDAEILGGVIEAQDTSRCN